MRTLRRGHYSELNRMNDSFGISPHSLLVISPVDREQILVLLPSKQV